MGVVGSNRDHRLSWLPTLSTSRALPADGDESNKLDDELVGDDDEAAIDGFKPDSQTATAVRRQFR